jgi:hypothetical protein
MFSILTRVTFRCRHVANRNLHAEFRYSLYHSAGLESLGSETMHFRTDVDVNYFYCLYVRNFPEIMPCIFKYPVCIMLFMVSFRITYRHTNYAYRRFFKKAILGLADALHISTLRPELMLTVPRNMFLERKKRHKCIQNHWVWALYPSSGIVTNYKTQRFGNRCSARNVVFSSYLELGRWIKYSNSVSLSVIHHRQNPLESTSAINVASWGIWGKSIENHALYRLKDIKESRWHWQWLVKGPFVLTPLGHSSAKEKLTTYFLF